MNTNYLIIYLLFVHFVADFMLQTNWMATNKSKNMMALGMHVVTYTLATFAMLGFGFCVIGVTGLSGETLFYFAALNGILHLFIDLTTSQFTGYFWKKKDTHNFFVVIGFDQFLHTSIIVLTYNIIVV